MQIGNIDFYFGTVQNVYSSEKKASVRLNNHPEPFHFYGFQKDKALRLNIGTKVAITKEDNFYNLMRLGTFKKIPTEDGSGIRIVWFAVVIAVYDHSILTSLGFIYNETYSNINVMLNIDNPYDYYPKDNILVILKTNNMPKKINNNYYVSPNKLIKVSQNYILS